MIYKFIDSNGAEITVNSLSSLEALVESETVKENTKVSCWHEEKNGDITPRDVEKKSRVKYWFKCDNCNHDFSETLNNITNKNKWCPYCTAKKICDDDECEQCYNNSFASLE